MINNRGGSVNRKAQALIEFVLILPILIMLLFSIIDFGNIYITKSGLENKATSLHDVVKDTDDYSKLKENILRVVNKDDNEKINVDLKYDESSSYLTVKLTKKVTIITPFLGLIVGSPYEATSERVIKYVKP